MNRRISLLRKDIRRRKSKLKIAGSVAKVLIAREDDLRPAIQAQADNASGADAEADVTAEFVQEVRNGEEGVVGPYEAGELWKQAEPGQSQ